VSASAAGAVEMASAMATAIAPTPMTRPQD
jgi:hypothetical protein